MAIVALAAWSALGFCIYLLWRDGWEWVIALGALIALDAGFELSFAAWRGRFPDAGLLLWLVP